MFQLSLLRETTSATSRSPVARLLTVFAVAALGFSALSVQAQTSTSLVVAFPAGGPADSLARVIATQLEKELKHTVLCKARMAWLFHPMSNSCTSSSRVHDRAMYWCSM